MCRPPSEQSILAVLGTVIPDVTIERIQAIPSPRLQRLYEVTISDGRVIRLVMSPSIRLRLLRSEHFMIMAEALAVHWIRRTLLSKDNAVTPDRPSSDASSSGIRTSLSLEQLVPNLLCLSPGSNELGSTCSFFEFPSEGTPIALVPGLLSTEERQQVDGQVGRLFRELARLTSPTGRFGPVANCLSVTSPGSPHRRLKGSVGVTIAGSSSGGSSVTAGGTEGVGTWSGAFHLMLEGILRDGEDMAVMISYTAIRRHFKRLRHLLDLVTIPRLVVIDGADESNVLVSSPPPSSPADTTTTSITGNAAAAASSSNTAVPIPAIARAASKIKLDTEDDEGKLANKEKAEPASTTRPDEKSREPGDDESKESNNNNNGLMVLAGLRDWSNSIFGDPLIATVFSDGSPSSSFLREFNNNDRITSSMTKPISPSPIATTTYTTTPPLNLNETIIEDIETVPIRRLLYQVYHASVSIVKEFYRPRGGSESSRRELEGRKKLTEALAKLELIQDHEVDTARLLAAKRSYRTARLSGEMSPAKRVKEAAGGGCCEE